MGFYPLGEDPSLVRAALDLDRVVAYDAFNRPDGALGSPDSGGSYTALRGTYAISGGRAVRSGGVSTNLALVTDAGVADVEVTTVAHLASGENIGVVLRAIDASNFLLVVVSESTVQVIKRAGGSNSVLASENLATLTGPVTVKGVAAGAAIEAYVNGARITTHTLTGGDETTFGTSTLHGVGGGSAANAAWESLVIRAR